MYSIVYGCDVKKSREPLCEKIFCFRISFFFLNLQLVFFFPVDLHTHPSNNIRDFVQSSVRLPQTPPAAAEWEV